MPSDPTDADIIDAWAEVFLDLIEREAEQDQDQRS